MRFTDSESAEVDRAAERHGVGTSTFLRLAGIAIARLPRTRAAEVLRQAQDPDGPSRQRSA